MTIADSETTTERKATRSRTKLRARTTAMTIHM